MDRGVVILNTVTVSITCSEYVRRVRHFLSHFDGVNQRQVINCPGVSISVRRLNDRVTTSDGGCCGARGRTVHDNFLRVLYTVIIHFYDNDVQQYNKMRTRPEVNLGP